MSPDTAQSDHPGGPTEDVASDWPRDFLTVEEAARVLRIGRTSAYQLAQQWCSTDGREGLPVVRVGRLLRVPRHALERLAGGVLSAVASPVPSAPPSLPTSNQSPMAAIPPQPNALTATTRCARRDDRDAQASLFPAGR
jgi:excisionase family DNA binding protein